MSTQRQRFGNANETLAAGLLKTAGYRILVRNFRTGLGEIDIVALRKDTIVFVEVKSCNSDRYGNPKYAVTQKKQRKISMVALQYLKQAAQPHANARFDVIAIDSSGGAPQIEWVKNAFELAYP
jgi:putative endonuclease